MKTRLLPLLICPRCLPGEQALTAVVTEQVDNDIQTGTLRCSHCGAAFSVVDGVALLDPYSAGQELANPYETEDVVASYLWSHYAEFMGDDETSAAYGNWAAQMTPQPGLALDTGAAVGRFTFEMSCRADFAIGIDTSLAFIRTARQLMRERSMEVSLKDEGLLRLRRELKLPENWNAGKLEFIVANALALPFRRNTFSLVSSLNLVDKVPEPLQHLREANRVACEKKAQLLFSDPFSWSTVAAPESAWLGGTGQGMFAGHGIDNVAALLAGTKGELQPHWQVEPAAYTWWKIRTHRNHFELIRSWFLYARR